MTAPRRRLRWLCHDLIDQIDTYCFTHSWVPSRVRVLVERCWEWTFRDKTWTAVGDNPFDPGPGIDIPCEWDDEGKPINSMYFNRTHPENPECQEGCVIHHRTGHHMMFWLLHWRMDRGIFERICEHGIGHPDPDQYPYWKRTDQDWQGVHGCDGCCVDH